MGTTIAQSPPATPARAEKSAAFLAAFSMHFGSWDADHDGTLQTAELDAVIANPKTTGDEAAALASVKRASRSKTFAMPPLTLENLKTLALAAPAKDQPDLDGMFADGQRRISTADRHLFSQGTPRLEALHQGKLGDCFCLAPLGAMLHRDAKQVEAMFKPQTDGSCDVTLGRETIRVMPPTDAEIAMSSSTEASGLWSNVYEKAAGLARNAQKPEKDRVGTPVDAIARGGSAGTMLAFITGHKIVRFSCKFAKDAKLPSAESDANLTELRKLLAAAVGEKRLITTGTNSTGPSGPTLRGIRANHAYAVLGYDAATDEIRLWDPHGDTFKPKGAAGPEHGYPRVDGLFSLPLTVFVKQYAGLAFEQFPITAKLQATTP